jgi:hypothetical protein
MNIYLEKGPQLGIPVLRRGWGKHSQICPCGTVTIVSIVSFSSFILSLVAPVKGDL